MARTQWAGPAVDHDLPVHRAVVLSLMFGGSAVLCGVAVTTTHVRDFSVETLVGTAIVGALIGGWLWFGRRHHRSWHLQAALLLYSVLVAVIAGLATSVNGITSLGPAVIMATACAGCFNTGRMLWLQIGVSQGGYLVGAALAAPPIVPAPMLTAMGVALGLGLVLHQLTTVLRERSLLDPLTGVLNRPTWVRVTEGTLRGRSGRPLTVALLDLDKFKTINDTLGHEAGDDLLRALGAAWSAALGDRGLLGRYGGDEFVVALPRTGKQEAAAVLAELAAAHPAPWTAGLATAQVGEGLAGVLRRADLELRSGKGLPPG